MEYDPGSLSDLLPIYYKRIFPHSLFYRWLNYGGVSKNYFTNREFSFTLRDDIYIRYLSFSDGQEFETELTKMCPHKIDIGAVFSHKPKDQKMVKPTAFQALEKELVFDIDMTDYDDVRDCCSGADICKKCWPLMVIGVQITDRILREDFGFKHRLWVYSGRRGVHCWVCDESARKLTPNARAAVAEYITLVKGGETQIKKVDLGPIAQHPAIKKAIRLIDKEFDEYAIVEQDFLSTDEKFQKVLNLLPDDVQLSISGYMKGYSKEKLNSHNRWRTIEKFVEERKRELNELMQGKKPPKDGEEMLRKCEASLDEIKLQYCYPRLDANVTKGLNHLLKSPFCIHPKTGRVCIPFDPSDSCNFDPFSVPTVSQLCQELESSMGDMKMKKEEHSSLRGSLDVFRKFISELEKSCMENLKEEYDKSLDF